MSEILFNRIIRVTGRDFLYALIQSAYEVRNFFIDFYFRFFSARKFSKKKNIRLHLGCCDKYKKDFINIDFSKTADLILDLRKKLPFEDGSVDYIYSQHFFEHLSYPDAVDCLSDYRRVLKKGGRLKFALPDIKKVTAAYLKRDIDFFTHAFESAGVSIKIKGDKTITLIDYFNYAIFNYRNYLWRSPGGVHRYLYDDEKMLSLLKDVGFIRAFIVDFDSAEDDDFRKACSFYVIAEK